MVILVTLEVCLELVWPIGGLLDLGILVQRFLRISAHLARALELVWGPISVLFGERRERFLNFSKFALKTFRVQHGSRAAGMMG